MLTDSQIREFHERGFLNVGRVLTDEQLAGLREGLDRVMAGETENKPELLRNLAGGDIYSGNGGNGGRSTQTFANAVVIQIVNIWEADERYLELIYNPVITEMTAQLCHSDLLRVWHDQIQYKPPGVGTYTGWHQDYPAWPILDPADLVTAWVALDDATIENGCMWMVPGSHKWGIPKGGLRTPMEGDDFTPTYDPAQVPEGAQVVIEPAEVKAGDCHFHHCLTWHGSPKNPSDMKRRAIAVHYMPGHTRFVPRGRHPMDIRVEVQTGEVLEGKYFPVVWDKGPVAAPQKFAQTE
jgi:ectoine hydroxylase-related dioxygenase (phytanoyl-CoA dioxygenase family)